MVFSGKEFHIRSSIGNFSSKRVFLRFSIDHAQKHALRNASIGHDTAVLLTPTGNETVCHAVSLANVFVRYAF